MYNLLDPETEKTYGANLCSGDPFTAILGALPAITSFMGTMVPMVENIIGIGDKSNNSAPAAAPAAAPMASPAQPGTSPTDFKNNETAYWNQLLAGTGISPTGQLPDSIQQNIDKQASLLG